MITNHDDDDQTGRILYISENAAEYLGHSMEDLLIHGDRFFIVSIKNQKHHYHQHQNDQQSVMIIEICCSIYDIVDKQDHPTLHLHLARYPPPLRHQHHHG